MCAGAGSSAAVISRPTIIAITVRSSVSGVSTVSMYWPSRSTVMRSVIRLSSSIRWEM